MKRWLIYGAVFALALLLAKGQSAGTDVGKLEPVEVVRISTDDGSVTVQTDTGEYGKGENLRLAIADLKQTADREIFLDTAEFLLVTPSALKELPELTQILRPACRVCLDGGDTELEAIASFLSIHKPEVTLREYREGPGSLPVIIVREERMYLVQP